MGHGDQERCILSGSVRFMHSGGYPPFSLTSIWALVRWYAAALIQGWPAFSFTASHISHLWNDPYGQTQKYFSGLRNLSISQVNNQDQVSESHHEV